MTYPNIIMYLVKIKILMRVLGKQITFCKTYSLLKLVQRD